MEIVPCFHNNGLNNNDDDDLSHLIIVKINCFQTTRIFYHERVHSIDNKYATVSTNINPDCDRCKANLIETFTSMGYTLGDIDASFEDLRGQVRAILNEGNTSGVVSGSVRFYRPDVHCYTVDQYLVAMYSAAWPLLVDDEPSEDEEEDEDDDSGPKPASRLAVEELERIEVASEDDESEDEDCAVCLEGLKRTTATKKKSVLVRMPCKHEFHESCILMWFDKDRVCPLCRFELPAEGSDCI